MTRTARNVTLHALFLMLVGCGGDPDPTCRCDGPVPGGRLAIGCGESACVGGLGYTCTGPNAAVSAPSACPSEPDAGPGECGPGTCSGCCQAGICQSGIDTSACGRGGGTCTVCGAGCAGGVCEATPSDCEIDSGVWSWSGFITSASTLPDCRFDPFSERYSSLAAMAGHATPCPTACFCNNGPATVPICEATRDVSTCSDETGLFTAVRKVSRQVVEFTLELSTPDGRCVVEGTASWIGP